MTRTHTFFIGVTVLCLLAACGSRRSADMRVSSWVSSPAETQLFESTLDSFRAAYPGLAFKFEPIPGNYSEKLQLMLGTHTGPDLFFLKGMVAPSYMSFEVLQPLDKLMAKEPDFDAEDFYPQLLQAFQRNGKQYGLPKDFAPYVLFYNKQLFAEAGIDSIPQDWQSFEAAAAALTQDLDGDGSTDQYGLVIEPTVEMVMPFVYQNEGAFQKADGSLGITDPAFIEALEYYHGMYKKGYATLPTDVGLGWNGDAFGRRKAAMCLSGGWLMPFLKENYPDLDYGVALLPAGKVRATIAFTTAYAIPKETYHLQDAWTMMAYMTGKTGMRQWTQQGLAMPSRRSVAEENGFYTHPTYQVFMESAAFARPFQVQFSERGFEEAVVALQAIFFTGKEPRQAMEDIKARIEKYRLIQ